MRNLQGHSAPWRSARRFWSLGSFLAIVLSADLATAQDSLPIGSASTGSTAYNSGEHSKPVLTLESDPASVAIDSQQLANAAAVVRSAVEDDRLPGAVILVARKGRVVLLDAFGHRDLARRTPMETDTLFRMASNSKAITAFGILALCEDGRLDLDHPIGDYLPRFATWNSVTLRHLLTHTSGCRIPYLFAKPLLAPDPTDDTPELIRQVNRFAEVPIEIEPGTTYSYNNACYNTLAAVIEQETGSYKAFIRERLYEPLQMNDSCNHEPDADHRRMAAVLKRSPEGDWSAGWKPGDDPDWPFVRGSGGMISTAWDYAKFCQMLLDDGVHDGKRILDSDLIHEMLTPQQAKIPAATEYGLGWVVSKKGGMFSHSGSDGTYVFAVPDLQLIGMLLTQTNSTSIPRSEFRDQVIAACQK